jgi:hypothetical protein
MNLEQENADLRRLLDKTADQLQKALVELARVKSKPKRPPSFMRMFSKKHLNEDLTKGRD